MEYDNMAKKNEEEVPLSVLPFHHANIEAQPGKTRKTNGQRRWENFHFVVAQGQEEVCPELLEVPLEISQDMGLMQQQDPGCLYQQAQAEQLRGDGERLLDRGLQLRIGCCLKWEGQRQGCWFLRKLRRLPLT